MKFPFTKLALRSSLFGLLLTISAALFAQDTQRHFLSGHGKDDAVPWRFQCTDGPQSGYWTNLPVPSNWELHGFGTLRYRRESDNATNEMGLYERDFTVPANWSGQRVFLVFDGVMTDTEARLNGESVGPKHQGGFYRFSYEVTKLVKPGALNRLAVTVHKHSANASVNRAERDGDYWFFGGIYRPVWIEAVPQQFIERVAIDARANGTFAMDVFVNSSSSADADTLEAQISDLSGQSVGESFSQSLTGEMTTLKAPPLKTRISLPRQWTAETPNLCRVEVRLKRGNQIVHRVQQRFGFRTFEVREGDGLYLNGQRIVLKGVNRHSFWPDSGRCLSEAVHRLDIEAMKDMNMNAVRMSHYPPDEQFLDLCDELGLYVLDELAGWQKSYDTPTGTRLIEQMIKRDVNHPSILFWDNGNEGGWNTAVDGEFARWDPQQRRVLHPWDTFNGVNTKHYLTYNDTLAAAEGKPMVRPNNHGTDPATNTATAIYMPTEFLHGLYDGGIGAGFEDYWSVMGKSKFIGGAFFWALVDEGVKRPDTGQIDVHGNEGPDGILGPYREREGSFYTVKELWSPIKLDLQMMSGQMRGTTFSFSLQNDYSFTDARQCTYEWQLRKFRNPASGFSVVESGKARPPEVPPRGNGEFGISVISDLGDADTLSVRIADPTGRELWSRSIELPSVTSPGARQEHPTNWLPHTFREFASTPAAQSVKFSQSADLIEVTAGDLVTRFSKASGTLHSVERGAQVFSFSNGPRLAGGEAKLATLDTKQDGSDVVISATYTGDLKSVTWRVRGNGWVQCDYTYTANGPKDYHGVTFEYPENLVKKKRWLGDGPYRVWKNRLRGVTLGVWENDYNNTITGWSEWKYPEFKGCFAHVRWMQLDTAEGTITAVPGDDDMFVQVLTPEVPPTNLQAKTRVSLPQVGLGFLRAIPPIGNKFHDAKDTGPQGQPNMANGEYSGSVSFYFGKLP